VNFIVGGAKNMPQIIGTLTGTNPDILDNLNTSFPSSLQFEFIRALPCKIAAFSVEDT
jgi:hypothetical protein